MYEADPALQEMPVFKCHRYPPTILIDANGETAQAFPDAWMSCGEFTPAEKTQRVIGTLRKVKNYGTRISASVVGHLSLVRRSVGDSQSRDSSTSSASDEEGQRQTDG
jgi:hypothetical protein